MIINKNAWHYRFQEKLGTNPQWRTNLCDYMRGVVVAFIMSGFLIAGGTLVIGIMTSVLWGWFIPGSEPAMWAASIMWILIGFVSAKVYADKYASKDTFWFKKHYIRKPKVESISIFSEWVKSVHDKTCPLVEFKDD